jgi:hypothetical protein
MDKLIFESKDGVFKYEIEFRDSDYIWIRSIKIEDWGWSSLSFGRKIENHQIVWHTNDYTDPMMNLISEFINYINRITKLRVYL